MNTQLKNQQQNETIKSQSSSDSNSLNFDLWAGEVKRQMIIALQKKQTKREVQANRKKAKMKLSFN